MHRRPWLIGLLVLALGLAGIPPYGASAQSDPTSDTEMPLPPPNPFLSLEAADAQTTLVTVARPGPVHLTLQGQAAGTGNLRVYGPDGTLIAETTADDQDGTITFSAPEAGTYLVRTDWQQPAAPAPTDDEDPASALPAAPEASAPPPPGPDELATPQRSAGQQPFVGKPSVSLVGLDPPPGTTLLPPDDQDHDVRRFLVAIGRTPPPGASSGPVTAQVRFDTAGRQLAAIALLDHGDGHPAPIGPGLTAGAGSDGVGAVQLVNGTGTASLSAGTLRATNGGTARTTHLRVHLCDVVTFDPPEGPSFGECYAEAVSAEYPVIQLVGGTP